MLLLVITNGIDVPLIGAQEKGQNVVGSMGRNLRGRRSKALTVKRTTMARTIQPPLKLATSVIG
jgi:hypothetical protein